MARSITLDKRRNVSHAPMRYRFALICLLPFLSFLTRRARGITALFVVLFLSACLLSACIPVAPLAVVTLKPAGILPTDRNRPAPPQVSPLRAPHAVQQAPIAPCPFAARLLDNPTGAGQGELPIREDGGDHLGEASSEWASSSLPSKFGIDPLHPIRIVDGVLMPTANPHLVAETGASWVRLNFVLGPWRSPVDRTRHHGCTWQETYRTLIDGYHRAGVRIYGLISYEAIPRDPGDELRAAPALAVESHPWVDDYVANFMRILRIFGRDLTVIETLNEPDDWHGGRTYWIHPAWLAIIQQRIYAALKADPTLRHILLVSGPLQGMTNNNNGAPRYLRQLYRQGKERFGWGTDGTPFPFDGVGLHLYLRDRYHVDAAQQNRIIEQHYRRYVGEVYRVIEQEEGALRSIYLSEIGWASRPEDESLQAANLRTAFRLIANDPHIALAIWFALQDFSVPGNVMRYGLYRQGPLTVENRKPSFAAFRETVLMDARAAAAP